MKKKRITNIFNYFMCILFSILIILQVVIWVLSIIRKNNTINIFGYMPFISLYNDEMYKFNSGDLVVTCKEELFNSKIVYEYEKNGDTIILTGYEYNKLRKTTKDAAKDIFDIVIKKVGKLILFFREPYIVIIVAMAIIILYSIICILRSAKDSNLDKKYIRIRRTKDVIILLFIIVTYITIYFIGKINSKENMDDRNILPENVVNSIDVNNIVGNNISTDGINNSIFNTISTNTNENTDDIIDTQILFEVTEDSKSWNQMDKLNIFKNEYLNNNKIYPEVSGKYEFKVENKSKYNFNYKVYFEEQNEARVNLKYKLIKNGKYLNDEYVSINELRQEEYKILSSSNDVYVIEWKWIDYENDTAIGKNADNIRYNLKISILGIQE